MPPRLLEVALVPQRLGDAHMNVRMRALQIERLLPAVDRPVVLPARGQRAAHVVIAVRAMLLVEPGEIEHLLGLFVVGQLGVGDDAVAV